MKTHHNQAIIVCLFLLVLTALVPALTGCNPDDDDDDDNSEEEPGDDDNSSDPCALAVQMGGGHITLESACGVHLDFIVRVAVKNESGHILWHESRQYPMEQIQGDTARWSGLACVPDLDFTVQIQDNTATLSLAMSQTEGCNPALVTGAELIHALPITSGGLELEGGTAPLRILQQGYDSWSFAGVLELNGGTGQETCQQTICPHGNNDEQMEEKAGHSWWMTALRRPDATPSVVVGALSAKKLKPRVSVATNPSGSAASLRAIWGMTGEVVEVSPEDSLHVDPFFFVVDSSNDKALRTYAQAAADTTPLLQWNGPEMRGWASWYEFFAKVTEQNVLDQLPLMADPMFSGWGLNVVQLDDGYIPAWGDWNANEKFPSGLAGLADSIEAFGFVPGIWMAPFLVDVTLPLTEEHPDWFLKDNDGTDIVWSNLGMADYRPLDPTHPEAATWLADQIRTMVDRGYKYLKLDFLFAGAYEGQHYDTSATSLSAFDEGMRIIREAAGDDVFILASGQPFLPTLGHAHAARTSTDIIGSFPGIPLLPVIDNIARYNAARYFTDRIWFSNDPDNLCVRSPLTDAKARVALASNLMGGSNVFLGDDLTALSPQQLSLLASGASDLLLSATGQATPLDLMETPCVEIVSNIVQDILLKDINRTPSLWMSTLNDGAILVALYSFDGNSKTTWLSKTDLGLEPDVPAEVFNVFTGDTQLWEEEFLEIQAQEGDVTLLRIQ